MHRPVPPFTGKGAGLNDEDTWAVMIQDKWGFVHQYLGLDADSVYVHVGDVIRVGHIVGRAPKHPESAMPPSELPPMELPSRYTREGYEPFPFRYRRFEVRVARQLDPSKPMAAPDAAEWIFYNPLLAHVPGRAPPSEIAPYAELSSLSFSRANPALPVTLHGFRHEHVLPMQGLIDVLVSFQAFMESPYDPADAMDPVSVYAMDWAAVPYDQLDGPLCGNDQVYWRRSFEHSRLMPTKGTELDDPDLLLSYYVPTVQVGGMLNGAARAIWRSQFDEKERTLIYGVSRRVLGAPALHGGWNVTNEPQQGPYAVAVRARSVTGAVGCVETRVRLGRADETTSVKMIIMYELLSMALWKTSLPNLLAGFIERMAYLVQWVQTWM